jgi:hypothetical protein
MEVRMTLPARLITSALFRGVFITEPSPTDHPFVPEDNPASVEKTRAALLRLEEFPDDDVALNSLWEENHQLIEREMHRHFRSSFSAALLERILSGLASQAKFFCDEFDEPVAWIARCANLETRRAALELRK